MSKKEGSLPQGKLPFAFLGLAFVLLLGCVVSLAPAGIGARMIRLATYDALIIFSTFVLITWQVNFLLLALGGATCFYWRRRRPESFSKTLALTAASIAGVYLAFYSAITLFVWASVLLRF